MVTVPWQRQKVKPEIMSTRDEVIKLGESRPGLSDAEIGRRLGISRERVRQIRKGNPKPQKPALPPTPMLTTNDLARILGLHPNTVRRWSNQGLLKAYRIGSRGDRRFRREDIDDFLKGSKIE